MVEIIEFVTSHWVAWLFAMIGSIATYVIGKILKRMERKLDEEHDRQKQVQKKNIAMSEGMQCLLRDAIVANYNKYTDRGYCPIYAKESLKRGYKAYHALGGNDVATKLYNRLIGMSTKPPKEGKDD